MVLPGENIYMEGGASHCRTISHSFDWSRWSSFFIQGVQLSREREREKRFNLSFQPALAYEDVTMLASSAKVRNNPSHILAVHQLIALPISLNHSQPTDTYKLNAIKLMISISARLSSTRERLSCLAASALLYMGVLKRAIAHPG